MKAQHLMEFLSRLDPQEEICALVYTRDMFAPSQEDGLVLEQQDWDEVVAAFDETAFADIYESIAMACTDSYKETV